MVSLITVAIAVLLIGILLSVFAPYLTPGYLELDRELVDTGKGVTLPPNSSVTLEALYVNESGMTLLFLTNSTHDVVKVLLPSGKIYRNSTGSMSVQVPVGRYTLEAVNLLNQSQAMKYYVLLVSGSRLGQIVGFYDVISNAYLVGIAIGIVGLVRYVSRRRSKQ
ncbi:hypothetical protein HS1genome_1531 [Sulfodiicoccus acidiphilus]|uniref:Uncharacterized protein n=1 Tax=Sulfodiicoccus acidiphilus TaxID=1670455 RepID=A0A348B4P0_9CREN|nr:hypothetical protein [Sulfodiicoccus acidiphilus]BBD73142.1 hypothetical protein HS1genome_1531 [Sulfodiicoccus acidiphilus]GGU00514.1 hypothetical protein GCM10007116_17180 [Sulfodiicoccus acidiphilus]